ncbi:MAG: amino acid permease, partial [Caldilineaceae bacterium]|nr:amino acid permease [Caldilineaceae bacterium]
MSVQTSAVTNGSGESKGRFGTFAGVFTPNVLTILGLILFLRTGWVVGQSGLFLALIIVLISNVITLLTGLSLSAISTSMRVRTGGNYYLISRSLGLEIGGAIGIPLYLSQAISVAFYVIGFTEALLAVPYFQAMDARLISTLVVLLFGGIAFIGADFALRIQYVVLAALGVALLSFFAGGWGTISTPTWTPSYSPGVGFWTVFAVFFPAVTGITVGASMSGDLKEPGVSIPRGTLASIFVTALIYVAAVIWLGLHGTPTELVENNLIMQQIARWPVFIYVGVWAATLSSALGSVMAAPRVLQALALDRVLPRWLASQMGSRTEPRVAVLLTTAIAVLVVWLGDLNYVAPIISMFFLNTYGMTN